MKNRLTILIIGVITVGVTTYTVHWFLANYERQYKEIRTDVSPQARRNPLLAAGRFLERLNLRVESISGRDHLLHPPAEPGVLLVHRLGPSLPPEREQALLQWIDLGGHLIVTPDREWDDEAATTGNHLLDRYGVRLHRVDAPESEKEELQPTNPAPGQGESESGIAVEFPETGGFIEAAFDTSRFLEDSTQSADWTVPAEGGSHLLQFSTGRGRLTVLSDNHWLSNEAIGERDHALMLALLVGDEHRVWLLFSSNMPSLLSLLWQSAPYFVASLLVLLLLWLWRLTLRTGPLLTVENSVRRNLLENLEASSQFAWRADRGAGMIESSQNAIQQEWLRRHHFLAGLGRKERCLWISDQTGLAPRAVEAALFGRVGSEQEMIRVTVTQQRLVAALRFTETSDNRRTQDERTIEM